MKCFVRGMFELGKVFGLLLCTLIGAGLAVVFWEHMAPGLYGGLYGGLSGGGLVLIVGGVYTIRQACIALGSLHRWANS